MKGYLTYEEVEALSDFEAIEMAKGVLERSKEVPDTKEKYDELYLWQYYLKQRFNGPIGEYKKYSGKAMSVYSEYLTERKRLLSLLEERDN